MNGRSLWTAKANFGILNPIDAIVREKVALNLNLGRKK